MDKVLLHQQDEKILVFYEADNVAYYIAQALECLGIKHLIYAKSLSSARRAQYVVTFNQSRVFRVLLMDVSQAAFGLDMSSASRVYFVNPVFSPQVEAQAVKRAHRIGQAKPVYVETLVLKGSIEEVIVERRKDMSTEEHNKCKSILDDQTMYDWIKNVRFQPIPEEEVPGPEQMAKLKTKQLVFGRGAGAKGDYDPDEDLVFGEGYAKAMKGKGKRRAAAKGKGKRTAAVAFAEGLSAEMPGSLQDADGNAASGMPLL
jgi:superfamily II DNA or RNA helicase